MEYHHLDQSVQHIPEAASGNFTDAITYSYRLHMISTNIIICTCMRIAVKSRHMQEKLSYLEHFAVDVAGDGTLVTYKHQI